MFTDNGLSGNTIFTLSSQYCGKPNCTVLVEFVPQVSLEDIIESLKNRRASYPTLSGEALLSGLVHSRISAKLCTEFGLTKLNLSQISDKQIVALANALKNTRCSIGKSMGVLTKDVNPITMESKLQKGLYLCGEILDIAGDCGGYNLQWAYSTANCVMGAILDGNG